MKRAAIATVLGTVYALGLLLALLSLSTVHPWFWGLLRVLSWPVKMAKPLVFPTLAALTGRSAQSFHHGVDLLLWLTVWGSISAVLVWFAWGQEGDVRRED